MSTEELDMRGISRCSTEFGWHAYSAGPCFDHYDQAISYRNMLDERGITWKSQSEPWGMYPIVKSEVRL